MEEHCLVGNGKLESVDYKDSFIGTYPRSPCRYGVLARLYLFLLIGSSYQLGQVVTGTYNCLCLLTGSYFIHFFRTCPPHHRLGPAHDLLWLPRPILERFICAHGLLTYKICTESSYTDVQSLLTSKQLEGRQGQCGFSFECLPGGTQDLAGIL